MSASGTDNDGERELFDHLEQDPELAAVEVWRFECRACLSLTETVAYVPPAMRAPSGRGRHVIGVCADCQERGR